jgi:hypothetical protein
VPGFAAYRAGEKVLLRPEMDKVVEFQGEKI